MKICPTCNRTFPDDTLFCAYCGVSLQPAPPDPPHCPNCHAQAAPDNIFCTQCGTPLANTQPQVTAQQPQQFNSTPNFQMQPQQFNYAPEFQAPTQPFTGNLNFQVPLQQFNGGAPIAQKPISGFSFPLMYVLGAANIFLHVVTFIFALLVVDSINWLLLFIPFSLLDYGCALTGYFIKKHQKQESLFFFIMTTIAGFTTFAAFFFTWGGHFF